MASTFVIGDIHGHLVALDAILASFSLRKSDTVITLGDYIDRGPDSAGVVSRLVDLQSRCRLVPLLGNHEELLLNARTDPRFMRGWIRNGGREALESYAGENATLDDIPIDHWLFFEHTCLPYYENDTHLFVHASADPTLTLDQQTPYTLRWQRFNDPAPHRFGKILICGHTPQRSGLPRNIGHAVCLDTGIHAGRYLTCLHLESGHIIQSDPAGKTRESRLADHLTTPKPPRHTGT